MHKKIVSLHWMPFGFVVSTVLVNSTQIIGKWGMPWSGECRYRIGNPYTICLLDLFYVFFLRRVGILEVYTGHSWIGRDVWKSWWSFNLRKFDPVTRKAVADSRINSNRLSTVMLCACIEYSRYSSQTYCSGILLGFVFFFACMHCLPLCQCLCCFLSTSKCVYTCFPVCPYYCIAVHTYIPAPVCIFCLLIVCICRLPVILVLIAE